jgi:hypothetical protein
MWVPEHQVNSKQVKQKQENITPETKEATAEENITPGTKEATAEEYYCFECIKNDYHLI